MAEVKKTVRLVKAANEFNIGKDTLVDFLVAKGHEVENKPTTKLSPEMYHLLEQEYSGQRELKAEADKVSFGVTKHDNVELAQDGITRPKKAEDQEVVLIQTTKASPPVVKKEAPKPAPPPEPPLEPVAKKEEPKKIEAEREQLPGAKIIGKIELDKKKEEPKPVKEEPKVEEVKPAEEKPVEVKPPAPAKTKTKVEPAEPEVEKTKKIILEGPKIVAKIDLPPPQEKKPKTDNKPGSGTEPKKRRKRVLKERVDPKRDQSGPNRSDRPGQKPQDANQRKRTRTGKTDKPEVSEKEVQEQIKATLAKLSAPSGKGKSQRVKHKRAKRAEHSEREIEAAAAEDHSILQVTEFISVGELSTLLETSPTDIISKCMSLGVIVSINQRLDAEIIELVANEFGFEVNFIEVNEQDEEEEIIDDEEDLMDRAPIVTIMGHVDHGKTSLLDYIREAKVAEGEAGGITQHIGAYKVVTASGKQIAFLDTPGHEAFTAMRARGAKITDVSVIVIAADDNIMPQTKEAISHSQAAGVPMVFAINKIDKENAQPEKIKESLAQMDLLVEDWGGKFQSQEISAKNGVNIDELLEKILLEAELLELKANPTRLAMGSVIEASLDKGRGYVTTALIQNGTLKVGDYVLAGTAHGKVKAMFNETGKKLKEAGPSTPALVLGLNDAPQAGEVFKVVASEQEAKQMANKRSRILREQGMRTQKHITLDEIGRRLALGTFKELNIILKADVDGSIEALSDSLLKLSTEEIHINIVHRAVGQITESDVLLASASDAIIIGFQVRPSLSARKIAERENIEMRLYSVIYNAIEEVKSAMEGMLEPTIEEEITSNVEVREVFKITKVGNIAGCHVMDGKINRNSKIRLVRDGIVIYTGEIASLKRFKDDAKEVTTNMECGIQIKGFNDIKVGDVIESFEEREIKRTL